MKIAFRVDASLKIGSGHLMRCLALAEKLKFEGHNCFFISRNHDICVKNLIKQRRHEVRLLGSPKNKKILKSSSFDNIHSDWLGVSQDLDFSECKDIFRNEIFDWLIIDHYSLDLRWEAKARKYLDKILVIDDLADRKHDCDILLDQTLGRKKSSYENKTPSSCKILCGSKYSLIRSEFLDWREYSLSRRENFSLDQILINLGGVDKDNFTCKVLEVLNNCDIPPKCKIKVIVGDFCPWVNEVNEAIKKLSWDSELKVGVDNMAEVMANSDLALGAAGSTTWERCLLGLPSIQIVIAENQSLIAKLLAEKGASKTLQNIENLPNLLKNIQQWMEKASYNARSIADGKGVERIICKMKTIH